MELAIVAAHPSVEDRSQMPVFKSTYPMGASDGLPVEVAHLLDVLARIESRRQARLRRLVQEGKD